MTREQIEKEARGYISDVYAGDGYFLPDYEEEVRDGFIAGAQWCINSVWHKPSAYGDELKKDVEVIAKTKRGYRFGKFDVVGPFHEYIAFVSTSSLEYALSDVLEYAYLDDLISERKEETNGGR